MPILNAKQILDARCSRTVEVDTPEWGDGASVLVGRIGGLARARIYDWLDAVAAQDVPAPESPDAELVTCDGPEPPGADRPSLLRARIDQLEPLVRELLDTLRDKARRRKCGGLLERADKVLADCPERVYSKRQEYEFTLRWCVESVMDPETLRPAFSMDQLERLGELDPAPLFRISDAAQALNLETKSARKDAEKNSATTPGGGSGSA